MGPSRGSVKITCSSHCHSARREIIQVLPIHQILCCKTVYLRNRDSEPFLQRLSGDRRLELQKPKYRISKLGFRVQPGVEIIITHPAWIADLTASFWLARVDYISVSSISWRGQREHTRPSATRSKPRKPNLRDCRDGSHFIQP